MSDHNLIRGVGFIGNTIKTEWESQGIGVDVLGRDLDVNPYAHYGVVMYTASYGNMYDQKDRKLIQKVNCDDVALFLNRLRGNFDLFVYLSTSSVYGNKTRAMSEEMKLDGQTAYAQAKIEGEKVVRHYGRNSNCVIVRPFSVTGVGEQDVHLIPSAIKAARDNLILNLDPDPVHDYIDIDDLMSGLKTIIDCHLEWGKGLIEVYNLGSGKQKRNDEVIDMIEAETQTEIKKNVTRRQRNYDSAELWLADITKIKKMGWKPQKPLHQSIKEMVYAYDRNTSH